MNKFFIIPKWWNLWELIHSKNKLNFGGGLTFITFLLKIIQVSCALYFIWFWFGFVWDFLHLSLYTNLVFMTTLYYLLLRYTLTLTLFIISLSWLIFELWWFWYPLISYLTPMSASPYLVETLFLGA